jgi:signal transduction histidine kinase
LLRQDTTWDEETEREFLETIDMKADELRDLIDKLLQMARLEAGQPESEREPVLVPHLARKIAQEMASRTKEHEITLEFPKSFPVVEADVRQIEQVLCNLLENAVKYSPTGGRITIAGESKVDHVLITVSDEGVGISKEHQNKVFERFFRANSLQTRGTPGTGLGLAIAKAHVAAHGGNIWVDSAPGMGSKFCFTWPLKVSSDQGGSSTNVAKGVR